jgi:CheY-like chemotaxis protein
MLNVRFHPDPAGGHGDQPPGPGGDGARPRFNVLLTEDRPHASEHWTRQLPRLLEPQGVAAYIARTGNEAVLLAERVEMHAAVIDLATPLVGGGDNRPAADPAQLWLVDLFRRLPRRPPIVVIHGGFYSQRQLDRLLARALKLGAFSVLAKPIDLEKLLSVFQRLVERRYAGAWPGSGRPLEPPNPRPAEPDPPEND